MKNANQKPALAKALLIVIMLCAWFALITQMYINIQSKAAPVGELIIRYFSYFTLLTNLIVAVLSSALTLAPTTSFGKFASRYGTITAATAYILIVGIVYNVVLRPLWKPTGLQKPVDELLHTVIPLLFLIFWLFFTIKKKRNYLAFLPWLLYPLVYVIFVLTRGSYSGFYPYPFIDLTKLPIEQVFFNSVGIAVAVIAISLLLISIGNRTASKRISAQDS